MPSERIVFIASYLKFSSLLDYVHFATKQPLKPTSIHVQQMPFTKHLIYKHFLKPLLLDFIRSPMGQKPDGQLNFSGLSVAFP